MKTRNFLILLSLLFFTYDVLFAEALSIEQAIDLALTQNIDLRKSSYAVNSALIELNNSWNIFMPSLSAGMGLSQNNSFPIFGVANSRYQNQEDPWNLSANFSMQIPLDITSVQNFEQRELNYKSTLLSQEELSSQIVRNVEKTYYAIQTYLKDLDIKKNNMVIAQARYESVQQKYDSGLSSDLDLLKAEVSVEEARLSYQRAFADYQKNINIFKRMIGVNIEQTIELITPIEIPKVNISPKEWIDKCLELRFDIRKLHLSIRLAENRQAESIISNFAPNFSASTSWSTGVNQAFTAESWAPEDLTASWSLRLSMSIPLNAYIPGSKSNLTLKSEADSMSKLLLDYEKARIIAEDEINSYARDLELIQTNIALSERLKGLSQRNYDAVQKSYNLGESTLLQVEDAQQSFFSAQLSFLNVQYQFLSTLIDLGYALNTDWHDF
ncbi:MAG: TolC family protein [Spirochaetales bacterium]|nr:TolC family protein [Spirochaetales bacterium]